jgi:hypothetical protein
MIVGREFDELIIKFPQIKLSYENITHNKVYKFDLILAVPDGEKCFAWLTTADGENICYIMNYENGKITKIKKMCLCFKSELGFGTIFYGTVFLNKGVHFFSVENIFYYKGQNISMLTYGDKLSKLKQVFKDDIKQLAYNTNFIVLGMPVINANYLNMIKDVQSLPYKIKYFQYRFFNSVANNPVILTSYFWKEPFNKIAVRPAIIPKNAVFKVTPDIQNDIYHLHIESQNYYDVSYIPNYETSSMMNSLFRNIKENGNLDLLEESDDDDDFENSNPYKHVYLDKVYIMKCAYNYKFKKWVPINTVPDDHKLSTYTEIIEIEKNNK